MPKREKISELTEEQNEVIRRVDRFVNEVKEAYEAKDAKRLDEICADFEKWVVSIHNPLQAAEFAPLRRRTLQEIAPSAINLLSEMTSDKAQAEAIINCLILLLTAFEGS